MANLTDRQIFEQFKSFGRQALAARNKCIGLLPEIHRREIFRQHGYESIYEFAAKLAGLSHEQVNRVLNLEPRLRDKPALHQALVTGEVSINKLRKVISIATVENQVEVAETIRTLSVRAVETLVCDQKTDGHVTTQSTIFQDDLQLSDAVRGQLLEMQKKGIDINKLLTEFLGNHHAELAEEKEQIADDLPPKAPSRYIPVKVKKILRKEHGTMCSVPGCGLPALVLHHTRRFALARSHSPHFIAPLCRQHHELAHHVDQQTLWYRRD